MGGVAGSGGIFNILCVAIGSPPVRHASGMDPG